ncbi:hypothetical protein AA313_de0202660 [Arthrobotrys entomopaga]|nr:hypothetical protein AA313_de0202660 [Arthrobotrys entomopaga]
MPSNECRAVANKIDEFLTLAAFARLPKEEFDDEITNILRAHRVSDSMVERILAVSWGLVPYIRRCNSESKGYVARRTVLMPLLEEVFPETP